MRDGVLDKDYAKVLLLLLSGWADIKKIQASLSLSDTQMKEVLDKLKQEGYIVTHTIH